MTLAQDLAMFSLSRHKPSAQLRTGGVTSIGPAEGPSSADRLEAVLADLNSWSAATCRAEGPSVEIYISVDDVTLAPELMRRLAGLFDSSSVSWDRAQNEVRIESEWGSRGVAGLVEIVGAWIEADGVASATLSMGDRSHTLVGSTPIPESP